MVEIVDLDESLLDEYVAFKNQSAEETEFINPTTKEKTKQQMEKYKEDVAQHAYVLMENKAIIGQLFLKIFKKKGICHILLISVLNAYQGKGHAKKLMEKAFDVAKNNNLPIVELIVHEDNGRAITFYEKEGFVYRKNHSKHNLLYQKNSFGTKEVNADPIYMKW